MTNSKLKVVGHRGAKGLALENTAPSIEAAIAYGVDQIEIDLRVSRDGRVVLLHDERPIARSGTVINLHDHTYAELLDYFPDMLTLDELLPLVDRRCGIMLEFKEMAAVEPSIKLLQAALKNDWQTSDFMFASFKFNILLQLHRQIPEIAVVVLDGWSSIRATHRARALGTRYISMDQRYLWWGVIRGLSRRGYKLFCYPHHRLIHIKHAKPNIWAKYGLYGVITDYPNFFRAKQNHRTK
jgi:glycerophosphoryl diester phosphodiesterase